MDELDVRIARQVELLAAARERFAIEAQLMFDYIDCASFRFYRPTLAHWWLLMEIEERQLVDSTDDLLALTGYVLEHDQDDVRNVLLRQLEIDGAGFAALAIERYRATTDVLGCIKMLRNDLVDPDAKPGQLEFRWWAQAIDALAKRYGWSEQMIFAIPIVRLTAYVREIVGDASRLMPVLPEEKILAELFREKKEMTKNGGTKT